MAQQYISSNRGVGIHSLTNGTGDMTTGTSSTASDNMEFRFDDSVGLTQMDLQLFFERVEVWFLNRAQYTAVNN